ncbi:hypothetical protein [Prosthecomicrobium sp. N25]|uniref:hypothetical protein n=1 Tax=Prosthecomicrobium sp. N25 TaxID=3129254 RepID=UPI003076E313
MLAHLDVGSWFIVSSLVILLAFWIGVIADALLRDLALGLILNTLLITGGGFAGLFALDWLFMHYYVHIRFASAYTWSAAGILGGTLALMFVCSLKRLVRQ